MVLDQLTRLDPLMRSNQRTRINQQAGALGAIAPIASDLGLTADTVKDYLGLFESIYFHHTIPAWTRGAVGRVVHRPKLHVVDSGIACHLHGVGVDQLAQPGSTEIGAIMESLVAGEIQRQQHADLCALVQLINRSVSHPIDSLAADSARITVLRL